MPPGPIAASTAPPQPRLRQNQRRAVSSAGCRQHLPEIPHNLQPSVTWREDDLVRKAAERLPGPCTAARFGELTLVNGRRVGLAPLVDHRVGRDRLLGGADVHALRSSGAAMSSGAGATDGRKRLDRPPTEPVRALRLPTSEKRMALHRTDRTGPRRLVGGMTSRVPLPFGDGPAELSGVILMRVTDGVDSDHTVNALAASLKG